MATSVFKRKEKKYVIDASQRTGIETAARRFMTPDDYGRTLITSVYLDTPERSLIARSLEKPLYKEKLRLRTYGAREGEMLVHLSRHGLDAARAAYGPELLATPAFFELKKKFEGIVYKRRVRMSLPGAWALANGASYGTAFATYPLLEPGVGKSPVAPSALDVQIAHELEAALERHDDLRPSAAVLCQRVAWTPLGEHDEPRITFDNELAFVDLAAGDDFAQPIVRPDLSIMEIKASLAMPAWLVEALRCAHAYPQSFSKYGEAALISARNRGERKALNV